MKKLITLLLTLMICSVSFGTDIQGQDNTVVFSDYITDVFREVAGFVAIENAHRFADSTTVKYWINVEREKAIGQLGGTERDTTFAVGTTTEEYALPSDYREIQFVSSIPINTGNKVALEEVGGRKYGMERPTTGDPKYYMIYKRKVFVCPTNNSNDSIVVHYLARSNTLSATTDTCNIDKDLEYYISLASAESILRAKRSNFSSAYTDRRLEEIAVAKAKEEKRLKERSKSLFEIISE